MTIKSLKKMPKETEEEKAFEKLIENFNNEAKKQGSKYKLEIQYNYPHLIKPLFWKIGNSLGDHTIFYSEFNKTFIFSKGINEQTFEDIHNILHTIKEEFIIELI